MRRWGENHSFKWFSFQCGKTQRCFLDFLIGNPSVIRGEIPPQILAAISRGTSALVFSGVHVDVPMSFSGTSSVNSSVDFEQKNPSDIFLRFFLAFLLRYLQKFSWDSSLRSNAEVSPVILAGISAEYPDISARISPIFLSSVHFCVIVASEVFSFRMFRTTIPQRNRETKANAVSRKRIFSKHRTIQRKAFSSIRGTVQVYIPWGRPSPMAETSELNK